MRACSLYFAPLYSPAIETRCVLEQRKIKSLKQQANVACWQCNRQARKSGERDYDLEHQGLQVKPLTKCAACDCNLSKLRLEHSQESHNASYEILPPVAARNVPQAVLTS